MLFSSFQPLGNRMNKSAHLTDVQNKCINLPNHSFPVCLFVKNSGTIRKTKPINSFFENKRNTGYINDEEFALLEDIYAYFDGLTAPYIEELRNMTLNNFTLTSEALARLKMFIPQIYWRIPHTDKVLDRITDVSSFKQTGFDFIDAEGKSADPELQAKFKSIDLFRKMYHIMVPFLTHNEKYRNTEYNNIIIGEYIFEVIIIN